MLRGLVLAAIVLGLGFVLGAGVARAASPGVVISEVYGGGGNPGAPYTNDFIELFNRGSVLVDLAGWSLQYASATGTGNFGASSSQITELPGFFLAPGQYYLVQESSGGANGAPLAPDIVDSTPIAMSATGGKVALVNNTTPLGCNGGSTPCTPGQLAQIVDLVGYGNANFFEGAGPAPAPSNTTSDQRASNGCTETDDNAADFAAFAPAPQNTASPTQSCTPTAAMIVSFRARAAARGIILGWRTAVEAHTLGFNVYRQQQGKLVKLNRALIPSVFGGTASGHAHSWLDRSSPKGSGKLRYRLQAVNLDGTRSWVGSATVAE